MATETQILRALMEGVDLDSIKALPPRPAWHAQAACRETPEVDFFPRKGQRTQPAREVCAGCPVRAECLAFAQDEHIDHGMWGGLTTQQRKAQRAKRASPAKHRTHVLRAG